MLSPERARITPNQFTALDSAGLGIIDQAPYQLPTLSEFRTQSHNNFRLFFWRNHKNMPTPGLRGQYNRAGCPVFERYALLYANQLHENEIWIDAFEYVDLDTLKAAGGDGKVFTRAERDEFNNVLIEPRLFTAWCLMSQLIDRRDLGYARHVDTFYAGIATSSSTATYLGGGS